MINLKKIQNLINYTFNDVNLLITALTHKSNEKINNNEKLEFLGDRVLGLVLAKKVYLMYPNENEGSLDKRFAFLVNKKTCLKIGYKLKLNQFMILGNAYTKKKKIEDMKEERKCQLLLGERSHLKL